jgi:ADP-heptose:LPS heptosyltransferase
MKKKPNILIYRLGSLGDTIMALPGFHGIRSAFPDSRITLLTNTPVSSRAAPCTTVLDAGYFFDEVFDYPVGTRNPMVLIRLLSELRRQCIDIAINLTAYRSDQVTRRDALFLRLAGAKKLVGFNLEVRDKNPYLDPETGLIEWEASRLARRVQSLAQIDLEDPSFWDLKLTAREVKVAQNLLVEIPPGSPIIAFSVGTKVQAKHWELQNWKSLMRSLSRKLPEWTAIFTGSAEEYRMSQECLNEWSGCSFNLCGKTSPRETAAIYQRCRLFVGHDSGPMHLAACVGVPVVAVFSARNLPQQWFPRGQNNSILYRRTDCAGCGLEVCLMERKKCILSIMVEEVEEAVMDLVSTQS